MPWSIRFELLVANQPRMLTRSLRTCAHEDTLNRRESVTNVRVGEEESIERDSQTNSRHRTESTVTDHDIYVLEIMTYVCMTDEYNI